jgi:hypothetical protein
MNPISSPNAPNPQNAVVFGLGEWPMTAGVTNRITSPIGAAAFPDGHRPGVAHVPHGGGLEQEPSEEKAPPGPAADHNAQRQPTYQLAKRIY